MGPAALPRVVPVVGRRGGDGARVRTSSGRRRGRDRPAAGVGARHGDAQRADDVRRSRPDQPAGRHATARPTSTRRPASRTPARDFDCAEIYVPFSWYEPMWLENLGFCDGGRRLEADRRGRDRMDGGDIPWNCSGGVLSSNPIGASGMIRFARGRAAGPRRGRRAPGRRRPPGARPRVRRRLAVLRHVGRRHREALTPTRAFDLGRPTPVGQPRATGRRRYAGPRLHPRGRSERVGTRRSPSEGRRRLRRVRQQRRLHGDPARGLRGA